MWAAVVVFAIVLTLLLIFILQNTESVQVSFLGLHGNLPLAVAMLLSAVGGILLAALVAGMRILQLRLRVRRQEHPPRA